MVNVDNISWMLITITSICNHWCEINCKTSSDSDDDTSTSDTDSENDSSSLYKNHRRMDVIKHESNKNQTSYSLSEENVKYFESEQSGLVNHHDDLDQHYTTMELDKNVNNYTTQKKQKNHDTKQYVKDSRFDNDSTIYFKVSDDIVKLQDVVTTAINTTDREETLKKSQLISTPYNKNIDGYYRATQFSVGEITHQKSREENEIFHDKNVKASIVNDEINLTGYNINWAFTTKTSIEKTTNGRTKYFKKGYNPEENLFDNAINKKPKSRNSLIKFVVKKITKRNDMVNSFNAVSTTTLSLKEFLNKHGLRPTELTSKQNYHYDHKTFGITLKNVVNHSYIEQEIMENTSLRANLRNKMNFLRSTRINVPEAFGLQLQQASSEEMHYSRLEPLYTTITTNTNLMEDLSPYAIKKQMRRVAIKYRENMNITIETLGRTVEYNDIVLLKITEADKRYGYFRAKEIKYAEEVEQKKIIFIVHGLSVMGMKYLISNEEVFHKILKYYTDYLDKFDIFLIPMANPDGYAATCNSHAGLYWNKNMSPQRDCPGVALDRNFNVEWKNTQNVSSCNILYPGPAPFSEVETRAVQKVFHLYGHRIVAYINVHASSFDPRIYKGDAVLYPHGYTDIQTDDDKYIDMKGEIDEAMKNSSFRIVTVTTDTLYNWYGKVSGTSVDYASKIYGIPYALEFSMQLYKGIQSHALETIWKRVIDVVFNNIWKNSQRNADY